MPDLRRQISYPRDLGETASSRGGGGGGAGKGEAWMRIRRRLRAELGEEVFSSWFGCLELDALSDQDVYLSVPTKFLKSWIQSHYVDRILPTLTSEFPAIKRVSINVRSSTRPASRLCHWRPPRSRRGRRPGFSEGPEHNVICSLPADGAFRRDNVIFEKTGFGGVVRGRNAHWFAAGPAPNFLEFPRRRVQSARPLGGAKDRRRGTGGPAALQSALSPCLGRIGEDPPSPSRRTWPPPRQGGGSSISPQSGSCMVSSPPLRHRQRSLSRKVFGR